MNLYRLIWSLIFAPLLTVSLAGAELDKPKPILPSASVLRTVMGPVLTAAIEDAEFRAEFTALQKEAFGTQHLEVAYLQAVDMNEDLQRSPFLRKVARKKMGLPKALPVSLKAGPPKPGDYHRDLPFAGVTRWYEFHVPRKPMPKAGWPVVLVFHGGGSAPDYVKWESKFDSVADANGFITVYPAGTDASGKPGLDKLYWNDGRAFADGSHSSVDDVGFSMAVVDDIFKLLPANQSQLYAAGYSNGAQFVFRLDKQQPLRFGAIGTVAGHRGPDEIFQATKPVSLIQFSGTADAIAPYAGGQPAIVQPWITILQPAPTVAQQWAKFDGITAQPVKKAFGKSTLLNYGPAKDGSEVAFWTVPSGHCWSGGNLEPSLAAVCGPMANDVVASQEMYKFFQRHPLKK